MIPQAVYPAFFALYVSKERRSSVQAMQFSNGLSNPVGLWLGHLVFDSIFSLVSSSIIIIIFAAVSNQFHGLGLFVSYATSLINHAELSL
jgi:ATP-binding cassette, subfamily A (ABC1), member 3